MALRYILILMVAYLLGSVPAAYIAARLSRGLDIREYGSGNVGWSNLWKIAPKWVAVAAFTYDIAKGALPVFLARALGLSITQQIVSGLAAITGHNWPVFLHFSGGRGIATTLGVTIFLMPKLTAVLLAVVLLSTLFHLTAVFTLLVLLVFPLAGAFSALPAVSYLLGWFPAASERVPVALALLGIPAIAILRRLLAQRSVLASSVSPAELFFNRLFLDRDIRDGKAWVSRNLKAFKDKK